MVNFEIMREPWNWAVVFIAAVFALTLVSLVSSPAE